MAHPTTPEEISSLLRATDGVNATLLHLPPTAGVAAADVWATWVSNDKPYHGTRVDGGEFLAYPLDVAGYPCTFICLSWTQAGFEGAALIDDHPATLEEAAHRWLGDTFLSEYPLNHPIREILTDDTGKDAADA